LGERQARLNAELTRRGLLVRAGALGAATLVAQALPFSQALAQTPLPGDPDGTLQAFADTILPGRKVAVTEAGAAIHPLAIAGVDTAPGAVETDALALVHHPNIGFDALEGPFLADLGRRALARGGPFLSMGWDDRVAVCLAGLDFATPARILWEAAAAVPFTAFCAAALVPEQTAEKAAGYRVMGLPGRAPRGYKDFSYRRRLSRERTKKGSLD
jgi:hypothetical protein